VKRIREWSTDNGTVAVVKGDTMDVSAMTNDKIVGPFVFVEMYGDQAALSLDDLKELVKVLEEAGKAGGK